MRTGRLGELLLGIGAAAGIAAVVGLVVGFEPARLPPALINLAVYKLTAVAAVGLLAAGAIVRRYDKREQREQREHREQREQRDRGAELSSGAEGDSAPGLPAGNPDIDLTSRRAVKEDARVPKRSD